MGKGFCATSGIFDREPAPSVTVEVVAAKHSKAHREAVVVIGFDGLSRDQALRMNFKGVLGFNDLLAEFDELPGHARDPISFLLARVREAADAGGALEKRRNRRE